MMIFFLRPLNTVIYRIVMAPVTTGSMTLALMAGIISISTHHLSMPTTTTSTLTAIPPASIKAIPMVIMLAKQISMMSLVLWMATPMALR